MMAFSVCSWNVEHFAGGTGQHAQDVVALLNGFNPNADITATAMARREFIDDVSDHCALYFQVA